MLGWLDRLHSSFVLCFENLRWFIKVSHIGVKVHQVAINCIVADIILGCKIVNDVVKLLCLGEGLEEVGGLWCITIKDWFVREFIWLRFRFERQSLMGDQSASKVLRWSVSEEPSSILSKQNVSRVWWKLLAFWRSNLSARDFHASCAVC